MAYWEFFDYITEGHRNPVVEWYGTLNTRVQAEFDVLVLVLSETEDWDEVKEKKRKCKELERHYPGLYELRFRVDGVHFRPLGILKRLERQFILLGGCEKHTFWTIPNDALDAAYRLKAQFEQGKGTTRAHI